MYDPSMRVLTVLELLQAHERVTGAELARRLEVSPRTVQRYIARLQDLGIPVESTRGVGGAYRLKPGFRLPPLMFSGEEALALALGLHALQHLGLTALAPAVAGASAKLSRTLPRPLRERVGALEDAVQLDAFPWTVPTDAAVLSCLLGAVQAQRAVTFAYRSHEGVQTRREVEVYGVVHLDGRWYAVGRCLLRDALRSFRLDRISEPVEGERTFTRPPEFDARAYLRATLPFARAPYEIEVWLDLPPRRRPSISPRGGWPSTPIPRTAERGCAARASTWSPSPPCCCGWGAAWSFTSRPNCGRRSACWPTAHGPPAGLLLSRTDVLRSPFEMLFLFTVPTPLRGRA